MKQSILVGSRQDPQCQILASYADICCFWEDWNHTWCLSALNGAIRIHLNPIHQPSRGPAHLGQGISQPQTLNAAETHLYLRYGGCPEAAHDQYLLLAALHPEMVGVARPGHAPLNKLCQLRLFGPFGPKTIVTNQLSRINAVREKLIVKNISPLRSQTATFHPLVQDAPNPRLAIPTLFQEKVIGEEFKYHLYKIGFGLWSLTAKILKAQRATDYRYAPGEFLTELLPEPPKPIKELATQLATNAATPLLDLDYFITRNGAIKILEWNDSPESVSFEGRSRLRQNWSFSRILLAPLQAITISPKNDRVVEVIAENHPLESKPGSSLVKLSCEDFTESWHFGVMNQSLIFLNQNKVMIPTGLYIRPVNVPQTMTQEYDSLFRSIELWPGPTFGSMSYGFYNSSKMFQTLKTLDLARKNAGATATIQFPKAYFIKGPSPQGTKLLSESGPLIVKSCSGARSIVVDQSKFRHWETCHLGSIPTLFQEAIDGPDIRVHGLENHHFAVKVASKTSIDYRYADERAAFEPWALPAAVKTYMDHLSRLEGNPLIGVDLIEKNRKFYCLEANPTPGWTWYYNRQTCKVNHLALGILKLIDPSFAASPSHPTDQAMVM